MNINIRLIKNFTTQYNKMLVEYGEEMARLNGFSDAQLSYTDFIDNFVDKQVVDKQVKKIELTPVIWTEDNGLLTPTLKLKRKAIKEHFIKLYEKLYDR